MPESPRLLFVDDESLLHSVFSRLFSRHGYEVASCLSATQAVERLKTETFDLVLTDFKMPDMDGLELLAHVRQHYPSTRVIMITAHANVQHAVSVMQNGALDYLPKPFSTEELVERVQRVLARPVNGEPVAPERPRARARRAAAAQSVYVGEHPTIARLMSMLTLVSRNRAPVFIRGESGTGKEVLARLIHEQSDRADGPYVTINCANLPRELVESHLFGHRKGSFTGAVDDMVGAFERADGGTLLLDEITEIELPVQAKLLRALQEQEIQKVGETMPRKVDVRIVATSNRNLAEAMQQGCFREDLYHRLAVFPLNVPPLRERASDVPLLAAHFADKYCRLYQLPPKTLDAGLLRYFATQAWPGNVRQLENLVHRGVLLSAERTCIELGDVLDDFFADAAERVATPALPAGGNGEIRPIEEVEREMILEALRRAGNNQQVAADWLGISSRTIRNKLRRYREEGHYS